MAANVAGDIGAQGISRMHWQRKTADTITVPDCNAAAAAWKTLWQSAQGSIPSAVTWSWQPQVTVIEHASAELVALLQVGVVPTNLVGTASGNYAAGNGLRVDWLTQSIHNRRFMRASNFMVPLASQGYDTAGRVAASLVTSMSGAAVAFLAALDTAGLELVAYGRPPKGQTTGGHVGLVSAVRVPNTPATLRSRRT